MKILFQILSLVALLLYVGQVISVLDFRLAQRLGLQEGGEHVDPVHSSLELWAARWDVLSLWLLPVAGVLLLLGHAWWPYLALIGGGAFIDAGGREAAKILGLRRQGMRTGSQGENRLMAAAYVFMILAGGISIATGLSQLA